jgi:hypothetical protein
MTIKIINKANSGKKLAMPCDIFLGDALAPKK